MTGRLPRRRVLALGAGVALSGCGFQPVYMPTATGTAGVAQRELNAVEVDLIPERPGQELRQALQDRLELGNDGVTHLYDLKVGFGISGEGIAVQSDTVATRIRMIGTATWTLVAKEGGVLRRAGHTEASVALCAAAGMPTVAAICEIMGPDGTMAGAGEAERFAQLRPMREELGIAASYWRKVGNCHFSNYSILIVGQLHSNWEVALSPVPDLVRQDGTL